MARQEAAGYEEFRRDLAENRLPRVIVLTGDETHLKEQALKNLLARLTTDGVGELNVTQFDGAEADPEAFFACAFAPSLFTGGRVVVVRRVEEAPWLASLPRHLASLPDTTALVLVAGASDGPGGAASRGRANPLTDLLEQAGPAGRRYDFPALRKREVLPLLQAEAVRLGLEVAPEALDLLQAKVGADLSRLIGELEKLALYLGPGATRVKAADVNAVVGRTALENSFALVDAVLRGETGTALSVLQDLFAAGESPQAIIAQLAAQFRRVVMVRALGAEGWPGTKLLRPLELSSAWAAEKVRDQARTMTMDQAERAMTLLLAADYRLKHRRGLVPEVELEVLVAELGRSPASH